MCPTMSMFSFTLVILHLAFCCSTARAADVVLKCPKWRNECPASLYCTLQNAKFNSATCPFFDMITEFRLKSSGSPVETQECIVNFTTSCDGTFNDQGCACRKDRNGYSFQRDLVVTETKHKNGSWICQPQCYNAMLKPVLSTSYEGTCSNIKLSYFILECRGIVVLCVGTALVTGGIIMIIVDCLGIAGNIGIALGGVGYVLLIAGSALMTAAYKNDEPAGIAILWVGSVLLIILGISISIIGKRKSRTGDHVGAQPPPGGAASAPDKGKGDSVGGQPKPDGDQPGASTCPETNYPVTRSAADNTKGKGDSVGGQPKPDGDQPPASTGPETNYPGTRSAADNTKGKGDHVRAEPKPDGDQPRSSTCPKKIDPGTRSAANNTEDKCLKRDFSVLAKVGTGLMLVGGTLAIVGGIVSATERCPSDDFPTTLQEILGLVLAVIGIFVFVVGIIIGIVVLQEQ